MNCKTTEIFAETVFTQTKPSRLTRGEWTHDRAFVDALCDSWLQQYEEYLGETQAKQLISKLTDNGDLYEHDPNLTLLAWRSNRRVGICSLRMLGGEHKLGLITQFEVLQCARRLGIGAQLLNAFEGISANLMAHVSIHRPAVKAFYLNQGFHLLQRTSVEHYGYALEFDVVAKRSRF
ncbi:MAG: GNAT family N-acetyltransferase [Granulosicoccus sp.]|nr:GNAT family N-acetyltransferase [Granulosicoccus sp.]